MVFQLSDHPWSSFLVRIEKQKQLVESTVRLGRNCGVIFKVTFSLYPALSNMSLHAIVRNMDFSKTLNELVTSATGYGSITKHVDCNSALALIGLILFLDVIRDLVDEIPDEMRRKRDVQEGSKPPPEIALFVSKGGFGDVQNSLNDSIHLLLNNEKPIEEKLCEVNRELKNRFGLTGRLFGTLMSNIVGRLQSSNNEEFDSIIRASRLGRTTENCLGKHNKDINR